MNKFSDEAGSQPAHTQRMLASRTFVRSACNIGLLLGMMVACSSKAPDGSPAASGGSGNDNGGAGTVSDAGSTATPGAGTGSTPTGKPPGSTPTIPVPDGGKAAEPATTELPLSKAAALGDIKYIPNRSSVRLYLPGVDGARDYRVFAVEDGVKVEVSADKREHVNGGTIQCSGLRQRNQCSNDEILPIKYNNEQLDLPVCDDKQVDRRPNVPTQLQQTMDVVGIGPNTTLIVEAIDRQCPFPGLFGSKHGEVKIDAGDVGSLMVSAVVNGKAYNLQRWNPTFSIRTEAEIRTQYGSMILNGQGPNGPTLDPSDPAFPESPYIRIAQPAPVNDPIVLARSVVKVSPTGTGALPDGFTDEDYFDDFEDSADQPKLLRDTDYAGTLVGLPIKVYQTKKWVLYDVANGFSDFMVDRGHLVMTHADTAQGSMTTQAMYPKRPLQLPTEPDQYIHVTYEVAKNETPRRYENFSLCGAEKKGETYDGETPKAAPVPRPGFMNPEDTHRTNVLGWNCLMLVPRGAGYGVIPGGDIASHPDTSLKITVVGAHPAPKNDDEYDGQHVSQYTAAFGPSLEPASTNLWIRQIDSSGKPVGPWLDDEMSVWQKTRFDVFVRRDRVVVYVEGQQRICQELTSKKLTMAEGALGFWHVLYHSSAEFMEIRQNGDADNPKTGQHHVMHNTPFADERAFDNVGFRENVKLPENFDQSLCYDG